MGAGGSTGKSARLSVSTHGAVMLHRPWLAPIVVGFWCVTTGSLVVAKILPSIRADAPPGYQALYASGARLVPVGWTVHWNDKPLGWAATDSHRNDDGSVDVRSRLQFDRFPLDEIIPAWAGTLARRSLTSAAGTAFAATGSLAIDGSGRLRAFRSQVDLPGNADGVVLEGTVRDGEVRITIRVGELRYDAVRHLPDDMMIGDELSPQATLPGLVAGRRWTVPVYSPLRPGGAPLQILYAEVEREENLYWDDRLTRVHVVTYREDPSSRREPRSCLWVDRSGRVLKHESAILGAKLAFVRTPDDEATRLVAMLRVDGAPAATPDRPGQPEDDGP
jgi:hypothetical protein